MCVCRAQRLIFSLFISFFSNLHFWDRVSHGTEIHRLACLAGQWVPWIPCLYLSRTGVIKAHPIILDSSMWVLGIWTSTPGSQILRLGKSMTLLSVMLNLVLHWLLLGRYKEISRHPRWAPTVDQDKISRWVFLVFLLILGIFHGSLQPSLGQWVNKQSMLFMVPGYPM